MFALKENKKRSNLNFLLKRTGANGGNVFHYSILRKFAQKILCRRRRREMNNGIKRFYEAIWYTITAFHWSGDKFSMVSYFSIQSGDYWPSFQRNLENAKCYQMRLALLSPAIRISFFKYWKVYSDLRISIKKCHSYHFSLILN